MLVDDHMWWKDAINRAWPRSQETGLFMLVDEVEKFNNLFKPRFLFVFMLALKKFNPREAVTDFEGKPRTLSAQLALTLKNMKSSQVKAHRGDGEEKTRDTEKAKAWAESVPGKEFLGRVKVDFGLIDVWPGSPDCGDQQTVGRTRTRPEDGAENKDPAGSRYYLFFTSFYLPGILSQSF